MDSPSSAADIYMALHRLFRLNSAYNNKLAFHQVLKFLELSSSRQDSKAHRHQWACNNKLAFQWWDQ
jgi:hypothetical protein